MFGCMPPRDVLLTVGNEILEATMVIGADGLSTYVTDLLKEYYNKDPT